jgi:virulence-associated protein VagC
MKQLLAKLFGFRRRDDVQQAEAQLDIRTRDTRTSGMILLVRDASSLGAYQLHAFDDDAAAAEFVQYWFPPGFEHGALAFWTGREQAMRLPGVSEKRLAEAVILIHDPDDDHIVHPFSMPDMELARAWLNEEASKGLNLRHTSLHWAARATIHRDARGRPYFRAVELPAAQPDGAEPADEPAPAADLEDAAPGSKTRIVRKGTEQPPAIGQEAAEPAPAAETEPVAAAQTAPEPAPAPEPVSRRRTVSDRLHDIAQSNRWEKRDEPFETFGSPPGRF